MKPILGLASFLAGLGLSFTGIRNLSATMLQLGGRPLRRAIAKYGQNPLVVAVAGIAAGALLQSSNGITFILVSMVTAGLLPIHSAMSLLLWANFGTSALVLVAVIDLHVVTLLSIGVAGIWLFLDRKTGTTRRQVLEAVLSIAILFLGLELLRAGTSGLHAGSSASNTVSHVVAFLGATSVAAFLLGFAVTLVTQSSSTTTIIAGTASQAGLLPFHNAALLVIGASLGSGVSVVLLGASTRGGQRQLVLFQGLTKLLGVLVLIALIVIEDITGLPLLLRGVQAISSIPGQELAYIYVAAQLAALAGYYTLSHPIRRGLAALAPPLPAENLAVPEFIYDAAVGDADIALLLAEKEEMRLTSQMTPTLEEPDPATAASVERLCEEIERFLGNIAGLGEESAGLPRSQLDHLVNLRARNEVLRLLHATVFELGEARRGMPAGEAADLADALTQGLGAVLLCANDAAHQRDDDNVGLLRQISSDRGTVVDTIRRRLVKAPNQETVYRLTSLFERAVWLVQRYALLLTPAA